MGKVRRRDFLVGGLSSAIAVKASAHKDSNAEVELRQAAALLASVREQARRMGVPLGPGDLASNPVPPEMNAAPLYYNFKKWQEQLPEAETRTRSRCLQRLVEGKATPAERRIAEQTLGEWQPLVELAREIAKRPHCDFELPWEKVPEMPLLPFAPMREAAQLLAAKAILASEAGQVAEAVRWLASTAPIMRHIGTPPIVVALLMQVATAERMDLGFRQIWRHQARNPEALPLLRDAHRAICTPVDLRHSLRGESLFALSEAREPYGFIRGDEFDLRTAAEKRADQRLLQYPEALLAAAFEARVLDFYCRVFVALDKVGPDPHAILTAVKRLVRDERKPSAHSYRCSRDVAELTEGWALLPVRATVRERLREASLDLLEVGQRTGAFPDALPRERIDPYDGQPLRYRRMPWGFVLYSAESGFKDAGENLESAVRRPHDLVVVYREGAR